MAGTMGEVMELGMAWKRKAHNAADVIDGLLKWAKERLEAETANRPDVNKYKHPLITTWNQVISKMEQAIIDADWKGRRG